MNWIQQHVYCRFYIQHKRLHRRQRQWCHRPHHQIKSIPCHYHPIWWRTHFSMRLILGMQRIKDMRQLVHIMRLNLVIIYVPGYCIHTKAIIILNLMVLAVKCISCVLPKNLNWWAIIRQQACRPTTVTYRRNNVQMLPNQDYRFQLNL